MYLLPFFLALNILALISQLSRKKRLEEEINNTTIREEVDAFRSSLNKLNIQITITIIVICIVVSSIFIILQF